MSINPLGLTLRTKKLGVLILDARLSARRSIEECATALGISPEVFKSYEQGASAPALPELEVLAFYLGIPLEQFWGRTSLSEQKTERQISNVSRLVLLRQKMIGASLRQARQEANLSPKEITERTGISEENLRRYELGETPIALPYLEALISILGSHIDYYVDQRGPVGKWMSEQEVTQRFLDLPAEIQEFVCQPVNRPYVELARRLSELSVEKLRAVAESLLEITY